MFKVVDLFAGPGGLAEGFSAVRDEEGRRVFNLALSVEKEPSAFATLRLRSFIRQFDRVPNAYYAFLAGEIHQDELVAAYPNQWAKACNETMQLELGTDGTNELIDPVLDHLRDDNEPCILVGGPPCQAYSLAGRSRNLGKANYIPSEDHRHFLYQEYIRILSRLRPAAFVMENVKGFLSAKIDGENIFSKVVADLQEAGGEDGGYTIFPLSLNDRKGGSKHILRSERHGVPQRRHRVILFGIRNDIAGTWDATFTPPMLEEDLNGPSVADAIADMPKLRSSLSRSADSDEAWKDAVIEACRIAAAAAFDEEDEHLDEVARKLVDHAQTIAASTSALSCRSTALASVRDNELADWIVDQRMAALPHHESRGHMESDLARYAFAATFTDLHGYSPKATDFPIGLAPAHKNWDSGNFNDRFRVQGWKHPSTTVTSHISKDGHYFIHPDPLQCRSLTVREAARLQTFPDNYFFHGNRTQQFTQVGNAVPPLLAYQIAKLVRTILAP